VCLFCGKDFKAIKGTKYCSNSCREKHKRRLAVKEKHCLHCGKTIASNAKYCSKTCKDTYHKENPKYTKKCTYCGKEFKTYKEDAKLCSKECQNKYVSEKTKKEREDAFKTKFECKYPNFVYISGYRDWKSFVKVKCLICGHEQLRCTKYTKASHNGDMTCDGCAEIQRKRKEFTNILTRRYNNLIKDKQRIARAKEIATRKREHEEKLSNCVCAECGDTFVAKTLNGKYCCERCASRSNTRQKELKRRILIRQNGKVDYGITLSKLIKRDNNTCHICGKKCNSEDHERDGKNNFVTGKLYPSIDHVIPVSKGGAHTWDNVKLAHHYCNSIKTNNTIYEDEDGQQTMAL
jgi:predicted nucleic acid-binding Zn ribbon protein